MPELVELTDNPYFNEKNTYKGWREYLTIGNINNKFSKAAITECELKKSK